MNFPGSNTLALTDAALMRAIEDSLNGARREGEDYVHVTEVCRNYGAGAAWLATITTDASAAVAIVSINDAEAA